MVSAAPRKANPNIKFFKARTEDSLAAFHSFLCSMSLVNKKLLNIHEAISNKILSAHTIKNTDATITIKFKKKAFSLLSPFKYRIENDPMDIATNATRHIRTKLSLSR